MKEYKSFYKTVEGNEGEKCYYPTRLDTYGCGCQHDCKYCYAKALLEFRGLWSSKDPSVADISKIEKKIASLKKGSIVRLGGMTDCFQPCEKHYKITFQTIKLLNKYGIHYLIVTKSNLVASDEYINILDKNLAHIQITVTSTSDDISLRYENATPASERIKAIEKLEKFGFDVQIRLSPFIAEYIDVNVIKKIKCKRAIVEFLRVNNFIKKTFNIDYSQYTHKEGGYYHLPLSEKINLINQISTSKEVSVCEDCNTAYNYWRDNLNPFPDDCCNLKYADNVKYIGNMNLLYLTKIAFLSSAIGNDDVYNKIDNWLNCLNMENLCVISGFQSKIELYVLNKLLKSRAKIIIVLAKKMYPKCPSKFKQAIKEDRLLIISPYNDVARVPTKNFAKRRNIYVINHSNEIVVGEITPNGMLENILQPCNKKIIKLS